MIALVFFAGLLAGVGLGVVIAGLLRANPYSEQWIRANQREEERQFWRQFAADEARMNRGREPFG